MTNQNSVNVQKDTSGYSVYPASVQVH